MAFSDFIDGIAPPWAKQIVGPWWNLFRLTAVLVDGLLEGLYQGRKAGMPNAVDLPGVPGYGGFEDTRSLDYIGRDRGVYRGLTETPPDYAYRLRHYQDPAEGGWQAAGLVTGVLEQMAGVLAGTGGTAPLMRLVNRAGDWWTREQDGTIRLQRLAGDGMNWAPDGTVTQNTDPGRPWNWDGLNNAPQPTVGDQNFAGGWFLIVYAPANTPYGTTTDGTGADPGIGADFWNDPLHTVPVIPYPDAGTGGWNGPKKLVDLMVAVILQRQCPAFFCSHIIIAFDPASFAPDGSSTGINPYPDGMWGEQIKLSGGSWVPSRLDSARYIPVGPEGYRWNA